MPNLFAAVFFGAAFFGAAFFGAMPTGSPPMNEPPAAKAAEEKTPAPPVNLAAPTLGGRQFWADVLHFHQWRIQRNTLSQHYRLIDGRNVRRAWGGYQQCLNKLNDIKQREQLPPMQGKAVILMHGLFRSRVAMKHMAAYLKEKGGYETFLVSYPSTRADIAQHAADLASVIERLHGIKEIHFVAHSLGNVVIRQYFSDIAKQNGGPPPDSRIGRFVMLAPPNQGARMAQLFSRSRLFRSTVGKSGVQLGPGWDDFQRTLATPACPFGIIAGGAGNKKGYNPLIEGDDDIIVGVAETRLAGADDFLVLPVIHTVIMNDPQVQKCTLRFLQTGCFLSPEERSPIPPAAPQPGGRP